VSRVEEVRTAFTSARIESISAAFVPRPDPKSDRGSVRRRRQRHPGRFHRSRERTNNPHATPIDSPGGSRVVKRAFPWSRSASAGPEPSGVRALEGSQETSRERFADVRREERARGASLGTREVSRIKPRDFRTRSTRGTRFSQLDLVRSADVGRNASRSRRPEA